MHWGPAVVPEQPWKCSRGSPSREEWGRAGRAHNTMPGLFQNSGGTETVGELRLNIPLFEETTSSDFTGNTSKGLQVLGNAA